MAVAELQTALDNIDTMILEISKDPLPDYNIDGQNVSWSDYFEMLTEQRSKLQALVQQANRGNVPMQQVTQSTDWRSSASRSPHLRHGRR